MKVLSLFSGVGGFDMGLENAGMETVFQCEWDKHANTILHKHWPDVPKWDDVSTLTGQHILANAPVVDVVAWGSPCQDLSVAGKRAGLEGGRSGLFHEGIRIIKELQEETNGQYPRISIWENVVGALNSNGGADFGVILDEMAEAGALAIEWSVLDAQYFGIPQRRRRVFVIAIFDPVLANRCPNPLLPVAESLPGNLAKGKQKRKSAATTLTEGVGTDGAIVNAICGETYHHGGITNQDVGSGHMVVEVAEWWNGGQLADSLTTTSNDQRMPDKQRFQAVVEQNVVGALAARDYKGVGNQYVAENKCIVEPILIDGTRVNDVRIYESPVQTLKERMGTGGNNVPVIGIQGNMIGRQDHNGPAGKGHTEEGDPMFTLTSTDIHAVASTMAVRRLTPLECEKLMGWPPDHTRYKADGTEQADSHRYKQAGNGVASPVAQWIAKHILAI
jgi:DNA (cytosine-5)-methyltransferase 1